MSPFSQSLTLLSIENSYSKHVPFFRNERMKSARLTFEALYVFLSEISRISRKSHLQSAIDSFKGFIDWKTEKHLQDLILGITAQQFQPSHSTRHGKIPQKPYFHQIWLHMSRIVRCRKKSILGLWNAEKSIFRRMVKNPLDSDLRSCMPSSLRSFDQIQNSRCRRFVKG